MNHLLRSSKTAPYWYRGYFKDKLTQNEVDLSLNHFNAKTIVVGHKDELPYMENANMLFDERSLQPIYKLVIGLQS